MQRLDVRDRGFATRIVLGVTGATGILDRCIQGHLRRGARLEPKVLDALRVSTYELLFLETPPSAAVSQGVELVRLARPRAAGMANAVLRKVLVQDVPQRQEALERMRDSAECGPSDLELVSGYPAWLLARMQKAYDVVRSAAEPAPVYVAQNRVLHDEVSTVRLLEGAGLAPRACDVCGSYQLDQPAGLATSGLVEATDVVPADLSAQRVVAQLPLPPEAHILEVGQGRGTKSLLLESSALRMGSAAHIVGIDSVGFKVRVAEERMNRAGLADVVICRQYDACELDARELPEQLNRMFDVVFVDAPCSGTGTMRRHPEICWNLAPSDVDELCDLQRRILFAAAARVRPGGLLCYATCSVLQEENAQVVKNFLATDRGRSYVLESEPLQTWPELGGPDGHFAALLRRAGHSKT